MTSQDLVRDALASARELVRGAVEKAQRSGALAQAQLPDFVVEIPADTSHGDFASNIAMAGAKIFRAAPQKIASAILENLELEGSLFARAQIAGPGFLNFFLKDEWFARVLECVSALGKGYGKTASVIFRYRNLQFLRDTPNGQPFAFYHLFFKKHIVTHQG